MPSIPLLEAGIWILEEHVEDLFTLQIQAPGQHTATVGSDTVAWQQR